MKSQVVSAKSWSLRWDKDVLIVNNNEVVFPMYLDSNTIAISIDKVWYIGRDKEHLIEQIRNGNSAL